MGTGKSTVGSALVGEKGAFESRRSATAVTEECRFVVRRKNTMKEEWGGWGLLRHDNNNNILLLLLLLIFFWARALPPLTAPLPPL